MRCPSPEVLGLMKVAAQKRAFGLTWASVARAVDRDERTCQRWAADYPDDWQRLYREGEDQQQAEVAAEALAVLYRTMRATKDERLAADAARFLYSARRHTLAHLPHVQPQANPFPAVTELLEAYDDAQLHALLDDYLADRRARRATRDELVAGGAVPPGGPLPQ
jgi:hypothetical protein